MTTSNEPILDDSPPVQRADEHILPATRVVSGKLIVLLMFLFGSVLTAFLHFYWTYHTARFRPLQDAIAYKFEKSMPRVEGGKRKLHRNDFKRILRVTMKIFFNPDDSIQLEQHADKLTAFIQLHEDISQFDTLEYHFYQLKPEQKIKQQQVTIETKDINADTSIKPHQ